MKRQADRKVPTDKLRTNTLGMLVVVLGFGLVIIYLTMSFTAHDAVWFLRGFSDEPSRIVIYNSGQRTELKPGQTAFAAMAAALLDTLNRGTNRPSGIGLSAGSQDDAYNLYLTVEVFFDHPVKLHAWFNTDDPTQMLFPITGRHSELSTVFLGKGGQYMSSGPVLNTTQPLRDALTELGYLP